QYGQERTQPTPVSVQDTVLLEAVAERREGEWSLTVSSDGLQAILRISPTVIIHREVAELLAARKLQLAVVEREEWVGWSPGREFKQRDPS
ncbi:MAG: hypothetical protein M1609_05145, partial [Firmicutes bacterium]|nr:hypothetical protein [Bacillota bacterium]